MAPGISVWTTLPAKGQPHIQNSKGRKKLGMKIGMFKPDPWEHLILGWGNIKLTIKHGAYLRNRQLLMICSTLGHKIQCGVPRIWVMKQKEEKKEQASSNEVSPTKEKKNNGNTIVITSQGVFSNIRWQLLVCEFNPKPCVWSCFSLANCSLFYGRWYCAEKKILINLSTSISERSTFLTDVIMHFIC